MERAFRVFAERSAAMNDVLDRMRDIVQNDVGQRGLRTDPKRNLVSETAGNFRAACKSLADMKFPHLAIVTGFFIPTATDPGGETDGPLGAVFLARALVPLGFRVTLISDAFCFDALDMGIAGSEVPGRAEVRVLPSVAEARGGMSRDQYCRAVLGQPGASGLTHLLAIERAGPNAAGDRCYTMRGRDITDEMSPAHWLFETPAFSLGVTTIGIGDGGNEIGMGKIPLEVIQRNIAHGGLVACRVPTDHLIVAGVSNWGAYALAAGVYALRGVVPNPRLFDPAAERRILQVMVDQGQLVDGVLGTPSATVDGLSWEQYSAVLARLRELIPQP
jgi:D-glutamate cyclase